MPRYRAIRSSFEAKVLAAFVAAVLVSGALATAAWQVAGDAAVAANRVSRTHEVLNSLSQTRADTLAIELSTQSYRVSGNPTFLDERNQVLADRERAMARLQSLLADQPVQVQRLADLRAVLDQRIAISRQVETLRATQGVQAATAYVATVPLQATREKTYALLAAMSQDTRLDLERHAATQLHKQDVVSASGVLGAALLLLLLTGTYFLIRRQLRDNERGQRALAQSEARLSTTLRSLGDAVLETDALGRVVRMNPVAERLTGWSEATALGQPIERVFKAVNEGTRLPVPIPVAQVLATGQVQELSTDTLLIRPDGSERPVGDSAAPIFNEAGAVEGVVLVFRDVSSERTAKRLIREQNTLLEQRVQERTLQLEDAQAHLRNVINSVPAVIAYVDRGQHYVYANDQYLKRIAPGGRDVTGKTVREVLGEERYAVAGPLIDKVLQGEPLSYDWQIFPGLWLAIDCVPQRGPEGEVSGYYVLGTDITGRKVAEEQIGRLNGELNTRVLELERVSRALRTLSAGNSAMLRARDEVQLLDSMCKAIVDAGGYPIAMVWYRQDDEARSTRVMAESGYAPGIGLLRRLKTSWKEGPHGGGAVAKAIRTGQTQVVPDMLTEPGYAQWREHLLGNASCIACPLHVNGEVIGALAIFAREPQAFGADEVRLLGESADDLAFGIASLRTRRMEEEARQQAYRLTHFDALTGLANGTRFVELINSAIETHAGTGTSFALLQTNIERLSEINDTLGFSQGDQMLQEFGTRLRATVSDASAIARLRGDEFAVLLAQSGREAASAMVHRLEDMLRKPFPLGDIQLDLSAKTGIVLFPEHGHTVHDLLRNMDVAVRQTKALGHNHAIYDPDTQQDRPQRLNMAGELRQAIEGGELLLYLQPKVEMASGRVLGSEALVRWQHPTRGLVPPMHFIELAEHTGLIKPLTDWVIEAAMRLIKDWQGQPHGLPIAVNLSAKNLQDEGMLSRLRLLQTGWGIPPGMLEAEITETAIMGDTRLALRVMNQLRDDGVRLYIDDFGTGYSSLAYLQKLPVHCIKIDQSFVRDIAHNKDSALIVKSTIDLAHDLGRKAVAEGIETQADWDVLEKFGCDVAQGYFIARPMPSEQFPQWFAAYGAKGPLAPQDLW